MSRSARKRGIRCLGEMVSNRYNKRKTSLCLENIDKRKPESRGDFGTKIIFIRHTSQ